MHTGDGCGHGAPAGSARTRWKRAAHDPDRCGQARAIAANAAICARQSGEHRLEPRVGRVADAPTARRHRKTGGRRAEQCDQPGSHEHHRHVHIAPPLRRPPRAPRRRPGLPSVCHTHPSDSHPPSNQRLTDGSRALVSVQSRTDTGRMSAQVVLSAARTPSVSGPPRSERTPACPPRGSRGSGPWA